MLLLLLFFVFVIVVVVGGDDDDDKNFGRQKKFTSIEMSLLSDTYPPCDILNVLFFKRKLVTVCYFTRQF
jgi:hypothetical protein